MKTDRALSILFAGCTWLVLSSCNDGPSIEGPPPAGPSASWLPGGLPPLLQCTPLPYDSVTQTIGPAGGMLQVGPHTLVVPAGALDEPVEITAVVPADSVNRVRFAPEGLVFQRAAALTMSYDNCSLLGLWLPKRIAYTDDALSILDYLLSFDNLWSHRVTGRLEHFSNYAVAW